MLTLLLFPRSGFSIKQESWREPSYAAYGHMGGLSIMLCYGGRRRRLFLLGSFWNVLKVVFKCLLIVVNLFNSFVPIMKYTIWSLHT